MPPARGYYKEICLVQWPSMGVLLHSVQQRGAWAWPQPA